MGLACALALLAGCGTTRMSDSARTATEQLLISNAVDRAINEMNFQALSGKEIYFDPQYLRGVTDEPYIESSLRQHLLASGCVLRSNREDAEYVVEARAGAVGTNRHDVLLGIPATTLPNMGLTPGQPTLIPEIPFAKSTQQKGVAKLAVFAYNQHTGQPVWQSGAFPIVATARDTWILGTGPFQRGSIYDGTRFAGSRILLPFQRDKQVQPVITPSVPVTAEAVFLERPELARKSPKLKSASDKQAAPAGGPSPGDAAGQSTGSVMSGFGTPTAGNGGTQSTAASSASPMPNTSGGNSAQGLLFMEAQRRLLTPTTTK